MRTNEYGVKDEVMAAPRPLFDQGRDKCHLVFMVDPTERQYIALPQSGRDQVFGTAHADNLNMTGFQIRTNTGSNLFQATLGWGSEKDFVPIETKNSHHLISVTNVEDVAATAAKRRARIARMPKVGTAAIVTEQDKRFNAELEKGDVVMKKVTRYGTAHHIASPGESVSDHVVIPTKDQLRFANMQEEAAKSGKDGNVAIAKFFSTPTAEMRAQPVNNGVKTVDTDSLLLTAPPLLHVANKAIMSKGYLDNKLFGRKPVTIGMHTGIKVSKAEYTELKNEYTNFVNVSHPAPMKPLTLLIAPTHTGLKAVSPATIHVDITRSPFTPTGYTKGSNLSQHM